MIRAELKKLFAQKGFWLVLSCFLLSQIVFFMLQVSELNDTHAADDRVLLDRLDYQEHFAEKNRSRIAELRSKQAVMTFAADPSFAQATLQRQITAYEKLQDLDLSPADERGLDLLIRLQPYQLTGLFFIFWLAAILFKGDRDEGLAQLINSLPRGRRRLTGVKTCVLCLVSFSFALLLKIMQLAAIGITFGLGDRLRPVQSNPQFFASPYSLTVTEFVFWDVTFFLLTALFFIALGLFCVSLFSDKNMEMAVIVGLFLLSLLLYRTIPAYSSFRSVKFFNLAALIDFPGQIMQYKDFSILGVVTRRLTLSVGILCVLTGLLSAAGLLRLRSDQPLIRIRLPQLLRQRRSGQRSLIGFELNRLLLKQKIILILLAVVLLNLQLNDFRKEDIHTAQRAAYLTIIRPLEGVYTQAKEQQLAVLIEAVQEPDAGVPAADSAERAIELSEALRIQSHLAEMQTAHSGKTTDLYVIDEAKGQAAFDFSWQRNLRVLISGIFVFIWVLALIGPDRRYQMRAMMRTLPLGMRRRTQIHLSLIGLACLSVNSVFSLVNLWAVHKQAKLLPGGAAIQSVRQLIRLDLNLTFNGLSAVLFICRWFALMAAGSLTYALVLAVKRLRTAVWLSGLLMLAPMGLFALLEQTLYLPFLPWAHAVNLESSLQNFSAGQLLGLVLSSMLISIGTAAFLVYGERWQSVMKSGRRIRLSGEHTV